MKRSIQAGSFAFYLLFFLPTLFAQTEGWETEKTKDGQITVKNHVSTRTAANGREEQLVEYGATTTTGVNIKKLVSIVQDVSKHKEFMDQKSSVKVKTLSDDACIVYYFYKGFWPYPSSDIVAKMVYNGEMDNKIARFTFTAAPTLLEDKGVKRLDYYHLTYLFKQLENGKVEMTVTAKFTPAVQLPVFLVGTWFPDGPANYLRGIIQLANEKDHSE